jgi:hypothetical protein
MEDGSLALMFFVTRQQRNGDDPGWTREATIPEIAYDIKKARLPAKSFRVIDPADVPTDRTFRNAWRDTGKAITVDMAQARDIHRDHLRQLRDPLMAALDVAYLRADEAGDVTAKKAISVRKQALRDATKHPGIDSAKTPGELNAIIPF